MPVRNFSGRLPLLVVGTALLLTLSACGRLSLHLHRGSSPEAGAAREPDRFLFDRATEALQKKRWIQAREYFRTLVDTYPTSTFRQDAKLGIGDSYLGEKRTESDILGASEFREFLRFYPAAERADYAQYKLALSQVRQVLKPERDQSPTRDALKELQTFLVNYPASQYLPDVTALNRQMRDRLSDSELEVARYYFKVRHYLGAISRLEELLKVDPDFTHRDVMYYYLAESYFRTNRKADAKALFQRIVDDFQQSDYVKEARQRIADIAAEPPAANAAAAPGSPATTTPTTSTAATGSTPTTPATTTPTAPGAATPAVR